MYHQDHKIADTTYSCNHKKWWFWRTVAEEDDVVAAEEDMMVFLRRWKHMDGSPYIGFLEFSLYDVNGGFSDVKSSRGFKTPTRNVKDELFDICRRAGISVKKEAPVNFLTGPSDGRSTLRPADVLVFGWVGGKHACVDLTGVSPLVGLSSWGFIVGQAALKAASCKVTKHEKACIENQHVFIPFAFDTFGFLAPEAVELLTRVQRVMNSNVMTPRSINVVFTRIGFAIQKGLAAQLVARLPSPTMRMRRLILPEECKKTIDTLILLIKWFVTRVCYSDRATFAAKFGLGRQRHRSFFLAGLLPINISYGKNAVCAVTSVYSLESTGLCVEDNAFTTMPRRFHQGFGEALLVKCNCIHERTHDRLRQDLLSRASNWAKFSATALGVIHRCHLEQRRSLMPPPYFLQVTMENYLADAFAA
ncbi:hypothetical protein Tco_1057516, partial [Tanacetum coccineum]